MLVPYSFVCYRDMIELYNNMNKPFFGEFIEESNLSNITTLYPNYRFMGSMRENPIISDIIKCIEIAIHNNTTDEIKFSNSINKLIYEKINKNQASLVSGEYLGVKTNNNELMSLELFFSEKYISFNKKIIGVYIPYNNIIERNHYSWFAKANFDECINTNYNISYILKKSISQYL